MLDFQSDPPSKIVEEEVKPKDITTEAPEPDTYKFGGLRYGFRGTDIHGPSYIVDETAGNYAYPNNS